MPTVTYQQPSTTAPLLAGVAGAFAGAKDAAVFNEDQRRFDQQLAQDTNKFNADLAFRVDQLKVMQNEGKLTREQQDRLALMEDKLRRDLQSNEHLFQDDQGVKTRGWQGGQNDLDRGVQERNSIRDYKAANYATRIREKGQNQEYTLAAQKYSDYGAKLEATGSVLSKYGDSATWDPTKREAAWKEYLEATSPMGSTTGQRDIPQLTPQEVKARRTEFDRLTDQKVYEAERTRYARETEQMVAAEAAGKSGIGAKDSLGRSEVAPRDMFEVGGKPDPLTGNPKLAMTMEVNGKKVPSPLSWYPLDELDDMIADAAITGQSFETSNRGTLYESTMQTIASKIDKMDMLSPATRETLKAYYDTGLYRALELAPVNGDTGGLE